MWYKSKTLYDKMIQSPLSSLSSTRTLHNAINLDQWEVFFGNYQRIVWRTSTTLLLRCTTYVLNIEISINNLPHSVESRCFISPQAPRTKHSGEISFHCEIRHRGWITFQAKSTRVWQFVKTTDGPLTLHSDDVIKVDETLRSLKASTKDWEKMWPAQFFLTQF